MCIRDRVGTDECMYPNETNLRGFIDRYTYTPTDGCIKQFWFRHIAVELYANLGMQQAVRQFDMLNSSEYALMRYKTGWKYYPYLSLIHISEISSFLCSR